MLHRCTTFVIFALTFWTASLDAEVSTSIKTEIDEASRHRLLRKPALAVQSTLVRLTSNSERSENLDAGASRTGRSAPSRARLLARDVSRLNLRGIPPPSKRQLEDADGIPKAPHKLRCVEVSLENASKREEPQKGAKKRCSHLDEPVLDQLRAVLPSKGKHPVAWTVVDKSYAGIAKDQEEQLRSVGFHRLIFVSVDNSTGGDLARELCEAGLHVIDYRRTFKTPLKNKDKQVVPWSLELRVAKAKFGMPRAFLAHRVDALFTEMDVFWLQNPMPEFSQVGPNGTRPSLVMGGHGDDPLKPNIGAWFLRGNAPSAAADAFDAAFDSLREWQSVNKSGDVFIFDQDIFTVALRSMCHVLDPRWMPVVKPTRCADDRAHRPYCGSFEQAIQNKKVVVRLMDNFRISSWLTPDYDEGVLAVHVLSDKPLTRAASKIQLAKIYGVFKGTPSYYEEERSDVRYLAWEGMVKSTDHGNGERYHPDVSARLLPLLLRLAVATGRVLVLPSELDAHGRLWQGEELFDVGRFQDRFGETTPGIRESTFLYNNRLNVSNMHPVAQVTVASSLWAASRVTKHVGETSPATYYDLGDGRDVGTYMPALVHLLADKHVRKAKTILLNFPLLKASSGELMQSLESCEGSSCRSRQRGLLRPNASSLSDEGSGFFCQRTATDAGRNGLTVFNICGA